MRYEQVSRKLGGSTKIAQALGIKRKQTVQQWKRRRRIPARWQIRLEPLTGLKADKAARKEAAALVAYINGAGA